MGESYLAGTEFRDSGRKENVLKAAMENLRGQRWQASLKNDEITVLVEAELTILDVIARENRIETGHLTLDDIYYELVNDVGVKIFFPLVQFQGIEEYARSINFKFDNYWWMFRTL